MGVACSLSFLEWEITPLRFQFVKLYLTKYSFEDFRQNRSQYFTQAKVYIKQNKILTAIALHQS